MSKGYSDKQTQTARCFAYKWAKTETYEGPEVQQKASEWLLERYCGNSPEKIEEWLSGGRKIILDAGCGSGFSSLLLFGDRLRDHTYIGMDISQVLPVAQKRFTERKIPGVFLQGSVMDPPFVNESVDLIFSEGVLHHTDDTGASIGCLAEVLKRGGRFLFYVYGKKAPIREYTDDYVRNWIDPMSDEEAWEAIKPLTKLGIALGELDVEIDVPEDIPILGIERGRMNLQRFFYWKICKFFYRKNFTFEEMHHINFDWFRPANCHRHTVEEVDGFCRRAGLRVEDMNVQESGITVVARKG